MRAPAEQTAAMQVAETTVPAAPPKAPPVTPTLATQGGVPRARARTAAWLLFIVGVLLAVYAAVFVSLSTAVVVAALLLSSSWIYVRRARGRARPPRR